MSALKLGIGRRLLVGEQALAERGLGVVAGERLAGDQRAVPPGSLIPDHLGVDVVAGAGGVVGGEAQLDAVAVGGLAGHAVGEDRQQRQTRLDEAQGEQTVEPELDQARAARLGVSRRRRRVAQQQTPRQIPQRRRSHRLELRQIGGDQGPRRAVPHCVREAALVRAQDADPGSVDRRQLQNLNRIIRRRRRRWRRRHEHDRRGRRGGRDGRWRRGGRGRGGGRDGRRRRCRLGRGRDGCWRGRGRRDGRGYDERRLRYGRGRDDRRGA